MARPCGCPDDYHLADCPIVTESTEAKLDRYLDAVGEVMDSDEDWTSEIWGA